MKESEPAVLSGKIATKIIKIVRRPTLASHADRFLSKTVISLLIH